MLGFRGMCVDREGLVALGFWMWGFKGFGCDACPEVYFTLLVPVSGQLRQDAPPIRTYTPIILNPSPNSNLHLYHPQPKYLVVGSFGPLMVKVGSMLALHRQSMLEAVDIHDLSICWFTWRIMGLSKYGYKYLKWGL